MPTPDSKLEFRITVLGRTLEHLGVQMYKRRDTAIAELVANCWDAGATEVRIDLPTPSDYSQASSKILITDNGKGMTPEEIQHHYLVVGRNQRSDPTASPTRTVMGRKGIGKLAGFGIATKMTVVTWQGDSCTELTLDVNKLKKEAGQTAEVPIEGIKTDRPAFAVHPNGTRIVLADLKHKTPLEQEKLIEAIGRRFTRTIRGEMRIFVNGLEVLDPALDTESRHPGVGTNAHTLPDGSVVKYYYAYSKEVIRSSEMRGFTVYVRGKTAQAPPFYFFVENTASGQHATRYLTGEIEADFLDEGTDDESDLISTDRQEIDWESDRAKAFREWGDKLTRTALKDWAERKGKRLENWIMDDAGLRQRIAVLDPPSKGQISRFLNALGAAEADRQRAVELADSLIRAYEYRHFHDVISVIESVAEDPESLQKLLVHLKDWKVLESRAILEIVKGRLGIIDRFERMIANNAAETAHRTGDDNMHDLLGRFPWILNPEWQVLVEETRITSLLKEWGRKDLADPKDQTRLDFLALAGSKKLVVIEIKRADYPVDIDDIQRALKYAEKLRAARTEDESVITVVIYGGKLNLSKQAMKQFNEMELLELRPWANLLQKSRAHYERHRALLEGAVQHGHFSDAKREIAETREVIASDSSFRGAKERKAGLGPQDVLTEPPK